MLYVRCPWIEAAALSALTAFACASAAASPARAEPIAIHGSTTLASRLIEPYRRPIEELSGKTLDILPSKSIHGLIALFEGRARIAMISSDLEGERDLIRQKRPELPVGRLRSFEVARTRVSFIVHPGNPVRRLELNELTGVLKGEITNWQQVGGSNADIVLVTVQPGGGVPTTVRSQLLDGQAFRAPRILEVEAPRHVVQITMQLEAALGLTQLSLARQSPVTELQLDRPVEQKLNLVTLDDPDAALKAVIDATRAVAARHMQ